MKVCNAFVDFNQDLVEFQANDSFCLCLRILGPGNGDPLWIKEALGFILSLIFLRFLEDWSYHGFLEICGTNGLQFLILSFLRNRIFLSFKCINYFNWITFFEIILLKYLFLIKI